MLRAQTVGSQWLRRRRSIALATQKPVGSRRAPELLAGGAHKHDVLASLLHQVLGQPLPEANDALDASEGEGFFGSTAGATGEHGLAAVIFALLLEAVDGFGQRQAAVLHDCLEAWLVRTCTVDDAPHSTRQDGR
jgi:hypothetical protein